MPTTNQSEKIPCRCGNNDGVQCMIHNPPFPFMKSNQSDWENEFDEKFKGWILQDDQECYRSLDIIKSFIRSLLPRQLEQVREWIDKLSYYVEHTNLCIRS